MTHFSYIIFVCSFLLVFTLSCEQQDIQNTTVQEVKQLITTGHDYAIIDVRTPKEFSEGSIPGSKNIDVKNENFLLDIEKLNKNAKYIVYCRSGKRSSKAYGMMTKAGFVNLLNMEGGYLAYSAE